MGKGKGMGYKNLSTKDPYIHSLSAKGVRTKSKLAPVKVYSIANKNYFVARDKKGNLIHKSKFYKTGRKATIEAKKYLKTSKINKKYYNLGKKRTTAKVGLIKEIARKVADGVSWAVEWEKEHLPKQEDWVKTQFNKAKQLWKKADDEVQDIQEFKQADLNDVRDELDTNDDGTQDISISDLEVLNEDLKYDLEGIDMNNNNIADAHEDGTFKIHDDVSFTPSPIATKPSFLKRTAKKFKDNQQKKRIETICNS